MFKLVLFIDYHGVYEPERQYNQSICALIQDIASTFSQALTNLAKVYFRTFWLFPFFTDVKTPNLKLL